MSFLKVSTFLKLLELALDKLIYLAYAVTHTVPILPEIGNGNIMKSIPTYYEFELVDVLKLIKIQNLIVKIN